MLVLGGLEGQRFLIAIAHSRVSDRWIRDVKHPAHAQVFEGEIQHARVVSFDHQ